MATLEIIYVRFMGEIVNINRRLQALQFLVVISIFYCGSAFAGDGVEERRSAAIRYMNVVQMAKMLDDSFLEMSKQFPEEKRASFMASMKSMVNIESLESIALDAMVKTFTVEELNALADFYGSDVGRSTTEKYGKYTAEFMPALQKELFRAMLQVKGQK